jgi:hypothetical protein
VESRYTVGRTTSFPTVIFRYFEDFKKTDHRGCIAKSEICSIRRTTPVPRHCPRRWSGNTNRLRKLRTTDDLLENVETLRPHSVTYTSQHLVDLPRQVREIPDQKFNFNILNLWIPSERNNPMINNQLESESQIVSTHRDVKVENASRTILSAESWDCNDCNARALSSSNPNCRQEMVFSICR